MTNPQNLLREFDSITTYLDAVHETVKQGHMPDMRGLDKRIADLCAALEQAPQDIQQQCLPKLGAVLEKLDICEAAIRAFQAARDQKVSQ